MLKDLDNTLFFNDDIVFVNVGSNNAAIFSDDVALYVDITNVSLDDDNFDSDNPETIIHVRLVAWCNKYKQREACKKEISKELMPVA